MTHPHAEDQGGWRLMDPRPTDADLSSVIWLAGASGAALVPGDLVQLVFEGLEGACPSEPLWVIFRRRDGHGLYGTLDSEPFMIEGLQLNDPVRFAQHQILSVHTMARRPAASERRVS